MNQGQAKLAAEASRMEFEKARMRVIEYLMALPMERPTGTTALSVNSERIRQMRLLDRCMTQKEGWTLLMKFYKESGRVLPKKPRKAKPRIKKAKVKGSGDPKGPFTTDMMLQSLYGTTDPKRTGMEFMRDLKDDVLMKPLPPIARQLISRPNPKPRKPRVKTGGVAVGGVNGVYDQSDLYS